MDVEWSRTHAGPETNAPVSAEDQVADQLHYDYNCGHVSAVEFVEAAIGEITRLRATLRAQILDEIEEQLSHEPIVETRRRKLLAGLEPP